MRAAKTSPLAPALRRRAEAFFGCDFAQVALRLGPVVGGGAAMASGDVVVLSPRVACLPEVLLDELIGHELTHVVQQRQGRAAPRGALPVEAALTLHDDEALEAEAEDCGRRFARRDGAGAGIGPVPSARPGQPRVVQRSVSVAGIPIREATRISDRARLGLGFVAHGAEWLEWAVRSQGAFAFADEAELVSGVQSGLHGSAMVLVAPLRLELSAARLMQLETESLRTLASARDGAPSSVLEVQVKRILESERLLTQSDFALARGFLGEAGVAGAPLFHSMALDDEIALYELIEVSKSPVAQRVDLQREAASFAVSQAQSSGEFVDYYKAYLVTAAKRDALGARPAERLALATSSVTTLAPCLFGALGCPSVAGFPPPAQVSKFLQGWHAAGRELGFLRVSSGVVQILEHSVFRDQAGEAAQAIVAEFLEEARRFVADHEVTESRLSQTAQSTSYRIESETTRAQLAVNAQGVLSLQSIRSLPKREVPPARPEAEAATEPKEALGRTAPAPRARGAGGRSTSPVVPAPPSRVTPSPSARAHPARGRHPNKEHA